MLRVTRQTTRLIPQFSHRTNAFKRSFIPSAIDLWNTVLDDNMRHTQSKAIFRRLIKKLIEHKPLNDLQKLWFYMGSRASQIITSQVRLEFSDLNDHLHKKQCVPSPLSDYAPAVRTERPFDIIFLNAIFIVMKELPYMYIIHLEIYHIPYNHQLKHSSTV